MPSSVYGTAVYGVDPYGVVTSFIDTPWTPLDGGNHLGADWELEEDTILAGVHYNIGALVIPAEVRITVLPYDPALPGSGLLTLDAEDVFMAGAIDASGAGYGAGGAGGGGAGAGLVGGKGSLGSAGGLNGADGAFGLSGTGGSGGAGAGPLAGAGGVGGAATGPAGVLGGYLGAAVNGDSSTDASVVRGSGGGGGAGGAGGTTYGGGGGGHGGRGGGAVTLIARTGGLALLGTIATNGTGTSGEGQQGALIGGDGGIEDPLAESSAAGLPMGAGGFTGGKGGAGAGGGILLYNLGRLPLVVTGAVVSALGGLGSITNGGTVKQLSRATVGTLTVSAGRSYSATVVSGAPIQYRGSA